MRSRATNNTNVIGQIVLVLFVGREAISEILFMFYILLSTHLLFFLFLAWKNFRLAMGVFIIALPSYLIRFNVGPLPSTVLELSFGALFLVWIVKYSREDVKVIWETMKRYKLLMIFAGLFFISSVISIFVSDMAVKSLGEWRAYFLEPMVLFLMVVGRGERETPPPAPPLIGEGNERKAKINSQLLSPYRGETERGVSRISFKDLIWFLALSTLSITIFSLIQQFTGWGIATAEWTSEATRRVTAFFSSPNAVGLYVGPMAVLIIGLLVNWIIGTSTIKEKNTKQIYYKYFLYILLIFVLIFSLVALLFTKSQGAWVGVGVGLVIFAYLIGYKKTAIIAVIAGIIVGLAVPTIRTAVLFQDKAGQNRLQLWSYSWEFLSKSPKNFVLGTGVRQFFRKVQKPHYNVKQMERLIYPHNIFLNFWTETGLLGMISFIGVIGSAGYLSLKLRKSDKIMGAAMAATLGVIVVHGLVDVPYFKNDLAMMFWIIMGIVVKKNFQ